MANPPFNQNAVDKERIKDDKKRFPFGMPTHGQRELPLDSALSTARSTRRDAQAFVMANSASDARGYEIEIRKKLIESGHRGFDRSRSVQTSFYTVTLPLHALVSGQREGQNAARRQGAVP